jgi:hypothetical protein
VQENSGITDPKKSAMELSGVFSLKYQYTPKYSFYIRNEFFSDPDGFMGGTIIDKKNKLTGITLTGTTIGAEYKPADNAIIRLEARELITDQDQQIFYWKGYIKNNRLEVMMNMGISF